MTRDHKNLILGALDSLALALAEHDHIWTQGERAIYEEATVMLGAEPHKFIEEESEEEE
jgi:hypothetical protein